MIQIEGLTRRFGSRLALDAVTLSVPAGAVHGLVGANGAGKTTLIRHVLGLLRAQQGTVRVFGRDPVADPVGVLSRVGYLSEENDLPEWMRVEELVRYSRAFRPTWDDLHAEALREAFALDPAARIGQLSKGQRARAGLLVALAHRPEMLVLDEPSSGLDPVVRRDILGAVMRAVADEGRTVVFSSHLLDEVEQVVDHVTMLRDGRVVLSAPLETVRASHRRVTLRFAAPMPRPPAAPGVLRWEGAADEWTALHRGDVGELRAMASAWSASVTAERVPTLDEVFVAHAGAAAPGA